MPDENTFTIEVKENWEIYRYKVIHRILNEREETFTVIASNKTVVFSSNRPSYEIKDRNI
jgi:hypothetical protein